MMKVLTRPIFFFSISLDWPHFLHHREFVVCASEYVGWERTEQCQLEYILLVSMPA